MAQESSLRSFCEAPENRHIIEREQKKQMIRSARLKQQQDSVQFRQKVLLPLMLAFALHFVEDGCKKRVHDGASLHKTLLPTRSQDCCSKCSNQR